MKAHPAPVGTIRTLLRDTALQVALLGQGASTVSAADLRRTCQHLISDFDAALKARHLSDDLRQDARYAQCALLDETALHSLPEHERHEWDATPLQVEHFASHHAGEWLFQRIAVRMCETPANWELLECYCTVLNLGFVGRYARRNDHERVELIAALDAQLAHIRPAPRPDAGSGKPAAWWFRPSPSLVSTTAVLLALGLYLFLDHQLDMQLAQLLPTTVP